jgi:hypothetical protein
MFPSSQQIRRRTLLQAGGLSALGLELPQLLAARADGATTATSGSATACILLYMTGGPAQQETVDMKPNANVGYRGVHASDFVATIYHALGYGHDAKVVDVTGRPHFIVEGKPVETLFR